MITAKEFLIQKFKDGTKELKGTENLGVIDWIGLMEEYAQYVSNPPQKNTIEERREKFIDLAFDINADTMILSSVEIWNTNGKSFVEYWTEHGENDRKMRFEKQASFDIKRRLLTWKNNNYNKGNKNSYYDKYPDLFNKDGTPKTVS